jgi:hypothetical protein
VVAVITDLIGIAVAIITVYAALTAVSRRSMRQLAESLGDQVRSASQNTADVRTVLQRIEGFLIEHMPRKETR